MNKLLYGILLAGISFFAVCQFADAGSLVDADCVFTGENSSDLSGTSVSLAGDVNGDGYSDIIIGASYADDAASNCGKTYLLFGSGDMSLVSPVGLSSADFVLIGENKDDYSGESVAGAGDVDGDGLSDILIFAGGNDDGGKDAGKTYLIFSSRINSEISAGNTSMSLADADYSFVGEAAIRYGYSGPALSGLGDIDGDGRSEVLIGYYLMSNPYETGKTYMALSKRINDDINAGTYSMNLSDADFAFLDDEYENCGGYTVCDAGDIDGDGVNDVLIGGTMYPYTIIDHLGKVYLVKGSTLQKLISSGSTDMVLSSSDVIFIAEQDNDHAGRSVAGAGDVNGDGYSDILIGASAYSDSVNYKGRSYLVFGSSAISSEYFLADADVTFTGENAGDYSGHEVKGAGDVDRDGYSDILISAYYNDDSYTDSGKTYVILASSILSGGADFNLADADFSFTGENADDHSGISVSGAIDIEGDGYSDILIGARDNDDAGSRAGKTYFISGGMLSLLKNHKANEGTSYWQSTGTAGVETDTGGNNSFVLRANGDKLGQGLLIGGDVTVMRIKWKSKHSISMLSPGAPYIEFSIMNEYGVTIAVKRTPLVRSLTWKTSEYELTLPEAGRYLRVSLKRSSGAGANKVYFDDIVVMPKY